VCRIDKGVISANRTKTVRVHGSEAKALVLVSRVFGLSFDVFFKLISKSVSVKRRLLPLK